MKPLRYDYATREDYLAALDAGETRKELPPEQGSGIKKVLLVTAIPAVATLLIAVVSYRPSEWSILGFEIFGWVYIVGTGVSITVGVFILGILLVQIGQWPGSPWRRQ